MALETTDNRKEYSGNGVTTGFSFPYYFLEQADLVVILRDNTTGVETLQVITTNFTVSGEGVEAGGTVTMLVAPASGKTLIIYRDPSIIQDKDFRENDSFPAEQAEEAWDRAAMISQRLSERIGRKVGVSEGFILGDFDLNLPTDLNAVGSEGKVILVNATLDGFEMGPTADDISNAQGYAAAAASSASASATSATNSQNSAVASAASAAASALAAASTLWRDVIFLTFSDSPYAVTDSQRGKLLAVDTSSGNVVINLPQISTLDLVTAPFALGVKKTTTDGNTVTLNRGGTDTIDGSVSKTINVAQGGTTLIPDKDPSPDQWVTADFGASAGNLTRDQFNGDNTTTGFTLSVNPGTKNNTFVHISGVYQQKDTYSISGTTLTFSTAPPTGTNNVEVMIGTLLSIGTPSDGTVTRTKLAQGAVANAAVRAVTTTATAATTDDLITASASGAAFTITLPSAVSIAGKILEIMKTDSSVNAVTVDGAGTETINGALTTVLKTQYEKVKIISDGSNWFILDRRISSAPTVFTPSTVGSQGLGTIAAENVIWSRHGAFMRCAGRITLGTVSSVEARLTLPLSSTVDSAAVTTQRVCGKWWRANGTGSTNKSGTVLMSASEAYVKFSRDDYTAAASPLTVANADALWASSEIVSFMFEVPITGWEG